MLSSCWYFCIVLGVLAFTILTPFSVQLTYDWFNYIYVCSRIWYIVQKRLFRLSPSLLMPFKLPLSSEVLLLSYLVTGLAMYFLLNDKLPLVLTLTFADIFICPPPEIMYIFLCQTPGSEMYHVWPLATLASVVSKPRFWIPKRK